VADISHLHPLMQEALRTGRLPAPDELAQLRGKDSGRADTVADTGPALNDDDTADPTDASDTADAQRLRDKYRQLVAAMIGDWHQDNPAAGNRLSPDERERIEDYCRRQIQHEWRIHRQQEQDDQDA
jgi:hypothetical protein